MKLTPMIHPSGEAPSMIYDGEMSAQPFEKVDPRVDVVPVE